MKKETSVRRGRTKKEDDPTSQKGVLNIFEERGACLDDLGPALCLVLVIG